MDLDTKIQKKKIDSDSVSPKEIHTIPLPKDTGRCRGCPYPGVGFICWSTDGSCMRTRYGQGQQVKEVMTD